VGTVTRVLRIREDKPALQNLLQKGSIGEELWNSILAAEKEIEAEIIDIVAEANSFVEGWGGLIFPTANEVLANEKMRARWDQTQELVEQKRIRYNVKAKAPAALAPSATPSSPAPRSPAPSTPAGLKTPNGLAAPRSPAPESAASMSDGDGPASSQTPSTPSKKGKKRK